MNLPKIGPMLITNGLFLDSTKYGLDYMETLPKGYDFPKKRLSNVSFGLTASYYSELELKLLQKQGFYSSPNFTCCFGLVCSGALNRSLMSFFFLIGFTSLFQGNDLSSIIDTLTSGSAFRLYEGFGFGFDFDFSTN
jgi:hypothetical protein